MNQPPSRGCELKSTAEEAIETHAAQPPSRGCELKSCNMELVALAWSQPPSRGCELKFEAPFIPVLR